MKPASFIDESHPSFGADSGWFLFSVRYNNAINKLLLVNAKNMWAVQCIERILGDDNKVSNTCECVVVMRKFDIGVRSDSCEVVNYIDFMIDMVDRDKITTDLLTMQAFKMSLDEEDIKIANERLNCAELKDEDEDEVVSIIKTDKSDPKYACVVGVLTGLGYKKAQIDPHMENLDISKNINEVVHIVLQRLAPS